MVRCKVPLCFPEWIYSAIWQVSESPRQICNGKRAVQERMCVISRFIDQKMKSEERISRVPFPFDSSPWRECGMAFQCFSILAFGGMSYDFLFWERKLKTNVLCGL